ncbi:MAG TPA: DUF1269 domain-containing protein [Polyangiales bacterium]|nr:DUF1269 domain-containing protein [Polyangiales bacterium]
MAPSAPRALLVLAFESGAAAQEALRELRRLQLDCVVQVHDAVVIEKDAAGNATTIETVDPEFGPSVVGSCFWGALVGTLVAGPVGTLAGAVTSAGLGALATKLIDLGIPDATVAELEAATPPGSTALCLLVSDVNDEALAIELARWKGVRLVRSDLSARAVQRLQDEIAASEEITRA